MPFSRCSVPVKDRCGIVCVSCPSLAALCLSKIGVVLFMCHALRLLLCPVKDRCGIVCVSCPSLAALCLSKIGAALFVCHALRLLLCACQRCFFFLTADLFCFNFVCLTVFMMKFVSVHKMEMNASALV